MVEFPGPRPSSPRPVFDSPTAPYGMVEPPQLVAANDAAQNRPRHPSVNPPRSGYLTSDWTRDHSPAFPWQGAKLRPTDTAEAVVAAEHERDRLYRARLRVQFELDLAEEALTYAQGRHRTAMAEQAETTAEAAVISEHGFTIGGTA